MASESPILNNPYLKPLYHYGTDAAGNLYYTNILPGRRPDDTAGSGITPIITSLSIIDFYLTSDKVIVPQ